MREGRPERSSGAMEAAALKDEGNASFKAGEFVAAIDAYTRALELDPRLHLCFSNRSAAYLKLGCSADKDEAGRAELLEKALADASKCVELEPAWAKGYSRQAAVLQELKLWDEAVAACQTGLEMSSDTALEKMRAEVLSRCFSAKLRGTWHGTVDEVLGGYDQEMEFLDETSVRVAVLGRSIIGRYWVDAGQEPRHLNIQVPMQEAPPGMPPPPPVPYIARIDDAGLHICCPFMTMDRPTHFEGPGYCLMHPGSGNQDPEGSEVADLSPEERLLHCAKELARALPDRKMEEVTSMDSEETTREKLMAQVKFESSMFAVQKKFGEEVMKKVLGATRQGTVPPALVGTPELRELEQKLSACGILETGDEAPPPRPPPQRPAPAPAPPAAQAEKAAAGSGGSGSAAKGLASPKEEPSSGGSKATGGGASSSGGLQAALALTTLGTALVVLALVAWQRRKR